MIARLKWQGQRRRLLAAVKEGHELQHARHRCNQKPRALGHSQSHHARPRAATNAQGQRAKHAPNTPRRASQTAASTRIATSATGAIRPASRPPAAGS